MIPAQQQHEAMKSVLLSLEQKEKLQAQLATYSKELVSKSFIGMLHVRTGHVDEADDTIKASAVVLQKALELLGESEGATNRGQISMAVEKYTELRLFCHFLQTNTMADFDSMQPCSDEEYVGAAIGFASEMSSYCVKKACEADFASIDGCSDMVSQLYSALLEFEFRNSPLRRKYDSLKYVVKKLADLKYELSIAMDLNKLHSEKQGADGSPVGKRMKLDDGKASSATESAATTTNTTSSACIPRGCFDAIRIRMEAYDKAREDVIKQSRDIQKLSKQGIFAIHRGGLKEAEGKFASCRKLAVQLIKAHIVQNPSLRAGSFGNSIEELAEGLLFLEWVQHRRVLSKDDLVSMIGGEGNAALAAGDSAAPIAPELLMNDFEYIGALSDLTGEIGRVAVDKATKRDVETIREIATVDLAVARIITTVNDNGRFNKKLEAVMTNMQKIDNVLYDLRLLEMSGGARGSTVDMNAAPPAAAATENDT